MRRTGGGVTDLRAGVSEPTPLVQPYAIALLPTWLNSTRATHQRARCKHNSSVAVLSIARQVADLTWRRPVRPKQRIGNRPPLLSI